MTFIKKNKKKICIIVGVLLILVLFILCLKSFLPDGGKTIWGNRLNGIEEHQISAETISKIKESATSSGTINDVKFIGNKQPISFIIYFKEGYDHANDKNILSYIKENLGEENLKYYEMEVSFTDGADDNRVYTKAKEELEFYVD